MPAQLTVCIPVYRSEAYLPHTLLSLFSQSYNDFVVEIAIEPPADAVQRACEPLLRDQRVRTIVNSEVLGWAENLRRLLNRVKTPYFMILFHDDLLANDYISSLIQPLHERPQASVAYADMACFGQENFRWSLPLTEEPIFDRLMSFFLGGAEALPVRGVVRSSVLENFEFPTDQYGGFASECEWVLHLLLLGGAIHVARPLYLKRTFGPGEISASSKRVLGYSREYLLEALEHHRSRMLGLIQRADLPGPQIEAVELAAEVSLLRRHTTLGDMGPFSEAQLERSEQLVAKAARTPCKYARKIEAMLLLSMSRHALAKGDNESALVSALAAVNANPSRAEAWVHLSRLQFAAGQTTEAYSAALRAWTAEPDGRGQRELIADYENMGERRRVFELMRSGQASLLVDQFDHAAYLQYHPDVAAANMDPWEHFCNHGWHEGRKFRLLRRRRNH